MWTKRQLIEQAFEELGLASYVYDLQPEQLDSALRRLDMLFMQWDSRGIHLGAAVSQSPQNGDLDTELDIPAPVAEAVALNLAIRLAPSYGKTVPLETKVAAKEALNVLLIAAARPAEYQYPSTMPRGSGNRMVVVNWPFFFKPKTDPLKVENNGQLRIGNP